MPEVIAGRLLVAVGVARTMFAATRSRSRRGTVQLGAGLSILCVMCASAPAARADRPESALDAPVANARLVAPARYQGATASAAAGASPLEIALQIAGEFEGAAQQVTQLNERSEAPSTTRVTVVRDGLLDDSIGAQRWDILLERNAGGAWTIREVKEAWICRRGESRDRFVADPCP